MKKWKSFLSDNAISGETKWVILIIIFCILFFRIISVQLFWEKPTEAITETSYGGVLIESEPGFLQIKENSCGMACLSFLLTAAGYPVSQAEIASQINFDRTTDMISLHSMMEFVESLNLKVDPLEVSHRYFRKKPVPCIMHLNYDHYVVFISFSPSGKVRLFDPSYGTVLLSYSDLLKVWDGKILYVYK